MNIGFITDSIGSANTGIGYYSFNFLKSLYVLGHNITIIDSVKKNELEKYCKDFLIIKNNFLFLKTLLWHFFLLKKIKNKDFDLVINPSFFPNVVGRVDNLIFTVHDLSMIKYPQHTKFGKGIYYKIFLPSTLKKSKKILADSLSTKKDLVEVFNTKKEKIKVFYPVLDKIFRKINNQQLKNKIKKRYSLPDKFYLYVGTIEPRKNISGILKAFDLTFEATRIPLVIVGKKGWKNNKIRKAFDSLKNKDKVLFTGYMDREDLPVLYNLATIFVFPSFYEGFGFPPLEAMACGCPVITSKNSSLGEICGNSVIYVDPYNYSKISQKMIEMSSNKHLLNELISRGIKRSKKFKKIKILWN